MPKAKRSVTKASPKAKPDTNNRFYILFGIALVVIILDQLTKLWALSALQNPMPVIGNFLSFVLVKNTGAGFGLFKGTNTLMIYLSLMVIGLILYYHDRIPDKTSVHASVALILGGGIANLVDRVRLGHVIDFIDVSFWPTFNAADTAITLGVIGFLVFSWKE
mgnify:CR=1 FL=1